MPTFSTLSSMSAKPFGQTTSLNRDFDDGSWITIVNYPSNNTYTSNTYALTNTLAVNTSNNKIYYVDSLFLNGSSPSDSLWGIFSFNSNGTSEYIKTMDWSVGGQSPTFDQVKCITVNSSNNNIYVGGSGAINYFPQYYILNSSLSSIMDAKEVVSGYTGGSMDSIVFDSSGNIYVVGMNNPTNTTSFDLFLMKYDASYNLIWRRQVGTTNYEYSGAGLKIDSSNNLYLVVHSWNGTEYESVLLKYNSSGVLQWQRKISSSVSTISLNIFDLCIDSNNNIYLVASKVKQQYGQYYDTYILKYNSSGVLQWQKEIMPGLDDYNTFTSSIAKDSNDNIYCIYSKNFITTLGNITYINFGVEISKLDTNGNLLISKTINPIMSSTKLNKEGSKLKNCYIKGFDIFSDKIYFAYKIVYPIDSPLNNPISTPSIDHVVIGKISLDLAANNGVYRLNDDDSILLSGSSTTTLTNGSLIDSVGTLSDASGTTSLVPITNVNWPPFTLANASNFSFNTIQ